MGEKTCHGTVFSTEGNRLTVELLRGCQSPSAVKFRGSVFLLRGTRDPDARTVLQSSLCAGTAWHSPSRDRSGLTSHGQESRRSLWARLVKIFGDFLLRILCK